MVQAIVVERVDQRLQDVLLPYHLTEDLGPVFTGKYCVRH
jgi:hypothetical protein